MTGIEQTLADIEAAIASAVADEARTGRIANVIREAASRKGDRIDDAEVARGVDFVTRYVRGVPQVLREALDHSRGTFAEDKMARMVEAAVTYWDAEDDVIPDDQGLLGILDDAYCSLSLVGTLSSRFERDTGTRLVATDLSGPTGAVRNLLGDPIARKLDDWVEDALADASMQELLDLLKEAPPAPPPANSSWDADDDALILKLFGVMG